MQGNRGVYRDRGSLEKAKGHYDLMDAVRHPCPQHPRHGLAFPQKKESAYLRRKKAIFQKLAHLREKSSALPLRPLILIFRFLVLVVAVPLFILFKEVPLALLKGTWKLIKKIAARAAQKARWFYSLMPSWKLPRIRPIKIPGLGLFKHWRLPKLKKREVERTRWPEKKVEKQRSTLPPYRHYEKKSPRILLWIAALLQPLAKVFSFLMRPFRFFQRKFGRYAKLPSLNFSMNVSRLSLPKLRFFSFTLPHLPSFNLRLKKIKRMSNKEALFPLALTVTRLSQLLKKRHGKKKKKVFLTAMAAFFKKGAKGIGVLLWVLRDIFRPFTAIIFGLIAGFFHILAKRSRTLAKLPQYALEIGSTSKKAISSTFEGSKKVVDALGLFIKDVGAGLTTFFLWSLFITEFYLQEARQIADRSFWFIRKP